MKKILLLLFFNFLLMNAIEKSTLIQQADLKMRKQEYIEAFVLYKRACSEEKNALGCGMAGVMLYSGLGEVKQNKIEGMNYTQKACEMGEMGSCVGLGEMLLDSDKNEENLFKAMDLFKKGCKANISNGCAKLGLIYYMDWSMQDKEEAIKFFKKACDIKDSQAQKQGIFEISNSGCFLLGKFYLDDKDYRDYKKAIKYLTKSCDLFSSSGCASLGQMYEKGLGTKKMQKKLLNYTKKRVVLTQILAVIIFLLLIKKEREQSEMFLKVLKV